MCQIRSNLILTVFCTVLLLSTCSSAWINSTSLTPSAKFYSGSNNANSYPSYCDNAGARTHAPCTALSQCPSHLRPNRCSPAQIEALRRKQEANKRRYATNAQRSSAKKLGSKVTHGLNGIMLTPGPRGQLGHTRRCEVAGDARIRELIQDQSDKLWEETKPFIKAAIDKLLNGDHAESWHFVQEAERTCLEIGDSVSRTKYINSIGGEQIHDLFQRECDISDHLEGVAEAGLTKVVGELFKTPAGEYVSLLYNKLIKGKWPNTVDYCSLVCRKNKSGIEERRCVIGCAETLLPNCWSQCDVYTCRRGCKNAFWHRRRKRRSCYRRCESKCTLN